MVGQMYILSFPCYMMQQPPPLTLSFFSGAKITLKRKLLCLPQKLTTTFSSCHLGWQLGRRMAWRGGGGWKKRAVHGVRAHATPATLFLRQRHISSRRLVCNSTHLRGGCGRGENLSEFQPHCHTPTRLSLSLSFFTVRNRRNTRERGCRRGDKAREPCLPQAARPATIIHSTDSLGAQLATYSGHCRVDSGTVQRLQCSVQCVVTLIDTCSLGESNIIAACSCSRSCCCCDSCYCAVLLL